MTRHHLGVSSLRSVLSSRMSSSAAHGKPDLKMGNMPRLSTTWKCQATALERCKSTSLCGARMSELRILAAPLNSVALLQGTAGLGRGSACLGGDSSAKQALRALSSLCRVVFIACTEPHVCCQPHELTALRDLAIVPARAQRCLVGSLPANRKTSCLFCSLPYLTYPFKIAVFC